MSTLVGTNAGLADGTGSYASFNQPTGIAVDHDGIYVADTGNHCIRKVTFAGVTSQIAGCCAAHGCDCSLITYPTGIAVDDFGTLFVIDECRGQGLRKITIAPFAPPPPPPPAPPPTPPPSPGPPIPPPMPLYHNWPCPVPGCNASGYDSLEPTATGGQYPFLAGDSLACKAWKLAATICTSPPNPYPHAQSGNFRCASSGGFSDPVFGVFCAVSNQIACTDCEAACNSGTCGFTPLSLRDCSGPDIQTGTARQRYSTLRMGSRWTRAATCMCPIVETVVFATSAPTDTCLL